MNLFYLSKRVGKGDGGDWKHTKRIIANSLVGDKEEKSANSWNNPHVEEGFCFVLHG